MSRSEKNDVVCGQTRLGFNRTMPWPKTEGIFLVRKRIPALDHLLYSSDLAHLKRKETGLKSLKAVKAEVLEILKRLPESDLQDFYRQWKISMKMFRDLEEDSTEGADFAIVKVDKQKILQRLCGYFRTTPGS